MTTYERYYRNKTILITGAASGIGKRIAENVSQISGTTLILWDRNPEILEKMQEDPHTGAAVYITGIDISDSYVVQLEAGRLIKQNLLPDIIINCAGIVIGKMFHEHTVFDIENTLKINTTGSMWVVHAFLNRMIERGSGHVVNLASASGYIGNPRMSVYAASKWAILGWSESLRIEMKKLKTGIHITAVIPGYIDTGMFGGVKAPVLTPILKTGDIVNRILKGVAKQKKEIRAPFIVNVVPLLKSILPAAIFDWLAGSVLGVYNSMDTFEGRKPKSL